MKKNYDSVLASCYGQDEKTISKFYFEFEILY
jgi:hypothetical protein